MTRIAAPWLTADATQSVFDALEAGGNKVFAVGGCVRNTLLNVPVSDIDMATDAKPEETIRLAASAGLRAIPTGMDHGTITLVAGGESFEITTFRRDVATDGRRAVVAFSKSAEEDAHRRDFTINALYADRNGDVIDPVGGLNDIAVRRVRFIDDAGQRIREDFLRTLRYFRFFAWYGDPEQGLDPDALDAIAQELEGLGSLSRERVGAEMLKLLAAPDPCMALGAMEQTGAMAALLGGGQARDVFALTHWERHLGVAPDPLVRLSALGLPEAARSLRLSKAQSKRLASYQDAVEGTMSAAELAYRHGAVMALQMLGLRAARLEMPPLPDALADIARGASAEFPLTAADLMPAYQGPALGARLRALEAAWIASGFQLDRAGLLSHD
ncbi:CCA tRNA nucleotidyltransferase [Roseobacteraceae bacterium S113]